MTSSLAGSGCSSSLLWHCTLVGIFAFRSNPCLYPAVHFNFSSIESYHVIYISLSANPRGTAFNLCGETVSDRLLGFSVFHARTDYSSGAQNIATTTYENLHRILHYLPRLRRYAAAIVATRMIGHGMLFSDDDINPEAATGG